MIASSLVNRCRLLVTAFAAWRRGPQAVDWTSVRAPLGDDDVVLQSPTHKWLRDLSRAVHPTQLCRHHPRVANRIAKHWHDPRRSEKLLRDLMADRRGLRRGFPPRIVDEIDRLYRHNAGRLNPMLRPSTPALRLVANPRAMGSASARPATHAGAAQELSRPG